MCGAGIWRGLSVLGCTGGGTRLFAIGALLRHSSALAASLALT